MKGTWNGDHSKYFIHSSKGTYQCYNHPGDSTIPYNVLCHCTHLNNCRVRSLNPGIWLEQLSKIYRKISITPFTNTYAQVYARSLARLRPFLCRILYPSFESRNGNLPSFNWTISKAILEQHHSCFRIKINNLLSKKLEGSTTVVGEEMDISLVIIRDKTWNCVQESPSVPLSDPQECFNEREFSPVRGTHCPMGRAVARSKEDPSVRTGDPSSPLLPLWGRYLYSVQPALPTWNLPGLSVTIVL